MYTLIPTRVEEFDKVFYEYTFFYKAQIADLNTPLFQWPVGHGNTALKQQF